MAKARRKFDPDFLAGRVPGGGRPFGQVARDLEINEGTFRKVLARLDAGTLD